VDLTIPNTYRKWNSPFHKSIVCPLVNMNRIVKVSGIVRFLTHPQLRISKKEKKALTSLDISDIILSREA
jgi:hypothetical protein